MKSFLKQHSIYLLVYLAVLLYVGNILLAQGKVQIHREINAQIGNAFLDNFFKYITHLGDGAFAIIVAVILSLYSFRKALYVLLSYFGAALVSTVLKHYVYTEIYRPHFVFQYFVREDLKEIDGVEMMAKNSFPSGHALSAFSLFFCLMFMTKNHFLKLVFFVLAFLAAYSRMYLSQHWLVDIYVGSIIGTCFAILCYFVVYQNQWSAKFDKPIQQLFKK